jgi:hypothetical protein
MHKQPIIKTISERPGLTPENRQPAIPVLVGLRSFDRVMKSFFDTKVAQTKQMNFLHHCFLPSTAVSSKFATDS